MTRGGPVLGFLVAITVLAELVDRAGVFDAAAGACARAARGSTLRLFVLIAALGTLTTIGMSLDTTAVLLTPVVLTATTRLGLAPLPFAVLAVWLANTASLLLPVSNLTNLLAVILTVLYLGVLFRRDLTGRYQPPPRQPAPDRWTFGVCALACLALAPGVLFGVPPWVAATRAPRRRWWSSPGAAVVSWPGAWCRGACSSSPKACCWWSPLWPTTGSATCSMFCPAIRCCARPGSSG